MVAHVAAFYGRQRELEHEFEQEEAPKSPTQGLEPSLPNSTHLAAQLDDDEQHHHNRGKGERQIR